MKIRITPGAMLLLLALFLEKNGFFLASLLAATVHECGHLLAARALRIPLRLLELDIVGARLWPGGPLPSYRAEAILAAAGPFFSLLLALPLLPFSTPFALALRTATLSLALFNLLPIDGFDGGRILHALLAAAFDDTRAVHILAISSYLVLFFLFALSSCLLLRYGQSISLAVLSASLFSRQFLAPVGPPAAKRRKARISENF